jgi:hypothetical protein
MRAGQQPAQMPRSATPGGCEAAPEHPGRALRDACEDRLARCEAREPCPHRASSGVSRCFHSHREKPLMLRRCPLQVGSEAGCFFLLALGQVAAGF